jgi:hypothetical protein
VYQLVDSGAKAVVVHSSLLQTALSAAKHVGFPVSNLWIAGLHSPATELQHIEYMLSSEISGESRPHIDPATDTAFLVYSSGTTGKPKGAMVTHTNFVADIILQRAVEGEHLDWRKDRLLALLPTYHIFGVSHYSYYLTSMLTKLRRSCMSSAFSSPNGTQNDNHGEIYGQCIPRDCTHRINHPCLRRSTSRPVPRQKPLHDTRPPVITTNGNIRRCTASPRPDSSGI